mmetsp:Transcript_29220/g.61658  ORF Transcript_29220/g.61658 Transcript_29220/m.61658 type:complete len:476 (+) Transcript_29220:133-1560(+)
MKRSMRHRGKAAITADHDQGIFVVASNVGIDGKKNSRRRRKCCSSVFVTWFIFAILAFYFYFLYLLSKRVNYIGDAFITRNNNTVVEKQSSSSNIVANTTTGEVGHRSIRDVPPPNRNPDPPTIPRRLIFTYKYNLIAPTKDDPPFSFADPLTSNVLNTISTYQSFWETKDANKAKSTSNQDTNTNPKKEEVVVSFLSDSACLDVITKVEPRLSKHFEGEDKGEFKADICRVAELYVHGGYYFDIDIGVVKPINFDIFPLPSSKPDIFYNLKAINDTSLQQPSSKEDIVTFASIWNKKGRFFQAFTAATPGHPVLKRSLEYMVAYYEDTLGEVLPKFLMKFLNGLRGRNPIPNRKYPGGMGIGPLTLMLAQRATTDEEWEEYVMNLMKERGYNTSKASESEKPRNVPAKTRYARYLYEISLEEKYIEEKGLFSNVPLQDAEYQKKNQWCNYICFAGPEVYFYSRVRGSKGCPLEK